MKATKQDMALRRKLFEYVSPEKIPVTYKIGDKKFTGIPSEFNPRVTRRIIDSTMTGYTVIAVTPEELELRVEYKHYNDFPVVEWVLYITNNSNENSPSISELKVLDGTLEGANPVLLHGNGDGCNDSGYVWEKTVLSAEPLVKSPADFDGNSCCGAFPYMRINFDDWAVNLAVGWSGTWESSISAVDNGAHIVIGQKTFNAYLRAGETVRTPSITLLAADGKGEKAQDRSRNLWRSWYFAHLLPCEDGKPLEPKLVLHTWNIQGKQEFCGCTEENQKLAIDSYISKGVKPDIWWIDAGWYPCRDKWAEGTGNFFCNPENYPNGMGAVGQYCHDKDIKFLLWFEPERIFRGTWVFENKPEFLLRYDNGSDWFNNNFLYNLGNKEACDWLIDTVDKLIKDYHIDIYRQDFNFQPLPIWTANDEEGRLGMRENLHIQGLYRYWDTLAERNPGLWFDNCSSGGKRNDIEFMRRSVPLHYTDIGYGKHPEKQNQYRQMFEWLPYFRSHTMAWDQPDGTYGWVNNPVDEFTYLTVMTAPAITCMVEYDSDDKAFGIARKYNKIWKETADISLSGDFYPLTVCRKSDEDWYAAQFDDAANNRGTIHFIRNIACEQDEITVKLHVDECNYDKKYVLSDKYKDVELVKTGKELAEGFTYSAPKRSGTVFVYEIR